MPVETRIVFAGALVTQVKVNDPSAAPEEIRHDAQIGTVEVKARKVVRQGQVGFAADDDEILVKSRDARRKGAGELVLPIRIGNADGPASECDAARIAAKRPFWVVSGELGQPLLKLGSAVLKKQDVLVAQDNEVAPRLRKKEVIPAKGVEAIRFAIVEIEILAVGRSKVVADE